MQALQLPDIFFKQLSHHYVFTGYNAVKLEEGAYFQYPDNIATENSKYRQLQTVLKEIIDTEPDLAKEVKEGTKDLEALEDHPKV